MTTTAITMMIVAMLVIWGGLAASIIYLRSKPEVPETELEDPDLVGHDVASASLPHPHRDL